jgi:hypothetical protein
VIINSKTAKALGLDIPNKLLALAAPEIASRIALPAASGMPNEAYDFNKNFTVSPECGITSLKKYKRRSSP